MKEQLYTIPLNDAFHAKDECPFCNIERSLEQELLDFVLGSASSYMESDVREKTDAAGFCRMHFKKMFDYGNTLGNAWILKTHIKKINGELDTEIKRFKPAKVSLADRFRKSNTSQNTIVNWVQQKEQSCYICQNYEEKYKRYLDTFFYLYKKEEDFRKTFAASKGFCLLHFGDLCEMADLQLGDKLKEQFYEVLFQLMKENMVRLEEDVSWLVEKFDYRNKDADWKNSKDAIQRGMQKLKGGYPADPVYQQKK